MNQQGIHVAPGEPSAKFDFLKVSNFLCEFRTEVDKARARFNLGIPDEYNFNWGNIKGTVTDQQDLVNVLNQQKNDYTAKYQDTLSRISGINDSINTINQSLLTIRNVIDNSNLSTLEQTIATLQSSFADYQQRLLNLTINVAQNSTDIADLARNGGGSGSSSLINTVNDLVTRVQNLENSSGQGGSNNYESRIAALENAIKINSLNSELIISGITNNSYIAVQNVTQPLPVRVLAQYSNLSGYKDVTEICTCSTQNANIASWDDEHNKIIFGSTTGTTTLTFSFLTASAQVEITVSETGEVTPEYEQYVGYGESYTDVIGKTNCKRGSVAGTFIGSPIGQINDMYGLWVCIEANSETIVSATENGYAISLDPPTQYTYGQKTYNCYLIGVISDTELENVEFVISV